MSCRRALAQWILHSICRKGNFENHDVTDYRKYFENRFQSSEEFFRRFNGRVDFKGKSLLDVGCGLGPTCYYVLLNGAAKAVGVDINKDAIAFAQSKLQDYPDCQGRVEFKLLSELNNEKFDFVLSKDSFEHYENPEEFILTLKKHVEANGKLIIGFSPLWKSPYGGHIKALSRWPWIHILFSESLLMSELKRFFRNDNLQSFKQVAGGINKMTLGRYLRIVQDSGLKIDFLRINTSSNWKDKCVLFFFNVLRLIPFLKEYFTVNLYSILDSDSDNLGARGQGI
jgi:SAM-dependent methyltransferase